MISKLLIFSEENGLLIDKIYRYDLPRRCEVLFQNKLTDSVSSELQPYFVSGEIHFYNIRREGVYFVACSTSEVSPIFVIEILNRFYHTCRDFCGIVTEQSISANILLIYELLEEILNEGYVQLLSTDKLRPFIQSDPVVIQKERSPVSDVSERVFGIETKVLPASASSKPVVQTLRDGDAKRNEVYVDVIERMTAVINMDSSVSRIEVNGSMNIKNFIAGCPQMKIKLNEDLVVSGDSLKGYGHQVQIDRCKLHPCVNEAEFNKKKLLMFEPPVGEFAAMSYNVTGEISLNPPFKLQLQTDDLWGSRDKRLRLRLQCDIPSKYEVLNVVVNIPVPSFISSVSSKVGSENQSSEYKEGHKQLVWKIKKMPGKTDAMAEFRLISHKDSAGVQYDVGPIVLDFEISGYTSSGLLIHQFVIKNTDASQPVKKFVRFLTVNESYLMRM